jgi:hypothetical protein
VYQKRKIYMRLIADYAKAAVNLYGVIHITELQTLILEYENKFDVRDITILMETIKIR